MKLFLVGLTLYSSIAYSDVRTGHPKNIVAFDDGIAFQLDCQPASSRLDVLNEIKAKLTILDATITENTCELLNYIYSSHTPVAQAILPHHKLTLVLC